MYHRPVYKTLLSRLNESRKFLQVLAGPRQTGKTTLIRQVMESLAIAAHYASADEPTLQGRAWIEQQWEMGRLLAREEESKAGALLVLDEIQKVAGWSETVKRLWDADTVKKVPLKVVLLGSAPLLIQRGLTESLAGRFE
ncbi:MAG: AAA family ATPase, partial [Deltaproteobacteria bacterium CG_4_10_14_3_um_filter_60_8]